MFATKIRRSIRSSLKKGRETTKDARFLMRTKRDPAVLEDKQIFVPATSSRSLGGDTPISTQTFARGGLLLVGESTGLLSDLDLNLNVRRIAHSSEPRRADELRINGG